jgi:uncharacterized membrane protein
MPTPHVLVVLGLLALTIRVMSLLALHLLPTGCNPIHDPVSRYALSRYGALDGIQKFAGGVCTLSLAGALTLLRAPLPGLGLIVLSVNGLALLLLVTVPARSADKDAPRSRRSVLHFVLALVSFVTIALATGVLSAPILGWSSWHGLAPLLVIAGIWTPVSVVLFIVEGGLARLRPYLGLFQRAIYLGTICWLGAAPIPLVR